MLSVELGAEVGSSQVLVDSAHGSLVAIQYRILSSF